MNELIETILANLIVDGEPVEVAYMHYMGHGEPYVVYMQMDVDGVLRGDDDLIGYADYYDFDVYSKGNFNPIVEQIKSILKENGFVWIPSRSSADLYETDTGYHHKTLNFAYYREEE